MTRGKVTAQLHRGPHHIRPRSRCLGNEKYNIYPKERWLPESKKHDNWHVFAVNLTPEEVVGKIKAYINEDGSLGDEFFDIFFRVEEEYEGVGVRTDAVFIQEVLDLPQAEQREEAWQIVFPGINGLEAVEWIEREFIRKEWLPDRLAIEAERRSAQRRQSRKNRKNLSSGS